jgi:RNA polymerase sigma factor (sigma-70 family)
MQDTPRARIIPTTWAPISRRRPHGRLSYMPLPPFQRFLDEHGAAVHRYLLVAVGPDAADDCWQEAMIAALRAYPRVREPHSLRGWALAIARSKALDAHRTGRRRLQLELSLPAPEAEPPPEPADDGLWQAVQALPDKQRGAVVRRFLLDLPYAEIGDALGCSEEAARRNVHEGLKSLREVIAR